MLGSFGLIKFVSFAADLRSEFMLTDLSVLISDFISDFTPEGTKLTFFKEGFIS